MRTLYWKVVEIVVPCETLTNISIQNADTLTDAEKCDLQDIAYIPKVAAGPVLPNKSEFRELIKIAYVHHSAKGNNCTAVFNYVFYVLDFEESLRQDC